MGSIKIQDSGYIDALNTTPQASSGYRVNSGTVLTLKTAEFTPALTRNISYEPNISSNSPADVHLGSIENMKFDLRCVLETGNATDMAMVQYLLDLPRTYGYKFLWYDYTSAATEKNNGQLIYQMALNSTFGHQFTNGEKTAFTISNNFYHLHVHIFDIQPRHSGGSGLITYSMKGVVLPVKTSSI